MKVIIFCLQPNVDFANIAPEWTYFPMCIQIYVTPSKKTSLLSQYVWILKRRTTWSGPRIINSLLELNINGPMLSFTINFLSNRSIQVRVNSTLSDPMKIENGVPQGAVLSVTLFLLRNNDITSGIRPPVNA